jgi:hypothetical protein
MRRRSQIRRGSKELALRIRLRPTLQKFFEQYPQAVAWHNNLARFYNEAFEEKHDRFHLPVFGPQTAVQTNTAYVNKHNGPQQRYREQTIEENVDLGNLGTLVSDLGMQFDGAMELYPLDRIVEYSLLDTVWPLSPHLNGINHKSADAPSPSLVDVEMHEPEADPLKRPPAPRHTAFLEEGIKAGQLDNPGFAQTMQKPSGSVEPEPEQRLLLQEHVQAESIGESQFKNLNSGTGNEASSQRTGVDAPINELQRNEIMEIYPGQGQPQSSSRFHGNQSAQSYLAWLHHRQSRFPTAAPNSSKCIVLAEKLGMLSVQIYDDVLCRRGFETDSRFGEWYRQNRLGVLGEDPRFDDEVMGRWEAWLKHGRDLNGRQ